MYTHTAFLLIAPLAAAFNEWNLDAVQDDFPIEQDAFPSLDSLGDTRNSMLRGASTASSVNTARLPSRTWHQLHSGASAGSASSVMPEQTAPAAAYTNRNVPKFSSRFVADLTADLANVLQANLPPEPTLSLAETMPTFSILLLALGERTQEELGTMSPTEVAEDLKRALRY